MVRKIPTIADVRANASMPSALFVDDVRSGCYPESQHIVTIAPAELDAFKARLTGE